MRWIQCRSVSATCLMSPPTLSALTLGARLRLLVGQAERRQLEDVALLPEELDQGDALVEC